VCMVLISHLYHLFVGSCLANVGGTVIKSSEVDVNKNCAS
jgi:hypothetical protein